MPLRANMNTPRVVVVTGWSIQYLVSVVQADREL